MTKKIKMTKAEALRNLKELEEYIKKLDEEKVGYKDDKMFLLSKEEYEKYKDVIPKCKTTWWLRSSSGGDMLVTVVIGASCPIRFGSFVSDIISGIRPALKTDTSAYEIGDIFPYKRFPYTVIDKDLAIATVPIAFDMFDTISNDYRTSEIRKFLLELGG